MLDSNAVISIHIRLFIIFYPCTKKTILFIDVEHDSSALGAVQNEQVGGVFFVIINSYSATTLICTVPIKS